MQWSWPLSYRILRPSSVLSSFQKYDTTVFLFIVFDVFLSVGCEEDKALMCVKWCQCVCEVVSVCV